MCITMLGSSIETILHLYLTLSKGYADCSMSKQPPLHRLRRWRSTPSEPDRAAEACAGCPAWSGGYPLNVVLGLHGMLHCTYGDGDQIALHSIDWDMLLLRCIGGAGDDLGHFLATAHNGDSCILDLGDDVSAMLTDVEFLFHNDTSMFYFGQQIDR